MSAVKIFTKNILKFVKTSTKQTNKTKHTTPTFHWQSAKCYGYDVDGNLIIITENKHRWLQNPKTEEIIYVGA
jgi:hypothetical protein